MSMSLAWRAGMSPELRPCYRLHGHRRAFFGASDPSAAESADRGGTDRDRLFDHCRRALTRLPVS
jgi:hypothetical protein